MKKFTVLLFLICSVSGFSQNPIKSKEDTVFLIKKIGCPFQYAGLEFYYSENNTPIENQKSEAVETPETLRQEITEIKNKLRTDSLNPDLYFKIANKYSILKDEENSDIYLEKAKILYTENLNKNPKDTSALINLAFYYTKRQQLDIARLFHEELLKYDSTDATALLFLSFYYYKKMNLTTAQTLLLQGIKYHPKYLPFYTILGMIQFLLSQQEFDNISDSIICNKSYKDYCNLSIFEENMKRYPEVEGIAYIHNLILATSILVKSSICDSILKNKYSEYFRFDFEQEEKEGLNFLQKYFESMINNEKFINDYTAYQALIAIYFMSNDHEKMLEIFEKGIVNCKDSVHSIYSNMVTISSVMGNYQKCLELQTKLNKIRPTNINYIITALIYFDMEDIQNCNLWTIKAYETDPKNFEAILGMAAFSLREKKIIDAEKYLKIAESINSESDDFKYLEAIFYLFTNKPFQAKIIFKSLSEVSDYKDECEEILEKFY